MALRYFATTQDGARTIKDFARFHLTSHSSASQTIQALVKAGYLHKKPGPDARSRLLNLSAKGKRILKEDPLYELSKAVMLLSDAQLVLAAEIMTALNRTIAETRSIA